MKICYIYEDGFSTNNGSNHLHSSIIKSMLENGNEVFLLQATNDLSKKQYPDELDNARFHCWPVLIKNVKKNNFIRRYLNGLSFCRQCCTKMNRIDFDLCFIQSSPTCSFNISNAKKHKKPIIYNIYDVFPGSAKELGIIKTPLLNSILKKIQKIGYKKADKIIVMSEDMKCVLAKEKIKSEKINVVYNWYDSDKVRFVPNEKNTFVKENNINLNKLIIQFAGNVGQVFGLEEFVELVGLLNNNSKVEFHIIGEGVKLQQLKKRVANYDNVKFFGWQPNNRMNEVFSYCDFEIVPLHHGVIGNNVPSKIALALACGKPIISIVEESYYHKMFDENRIGYAYSHDEIQKLGDKLTWLAENKDSIRDLFPDCVEFAKNHYSKKRNIDKIMAILSETANSQ